MQESHNVLERRAQATAGWFETLDKQHENEDSIQIDDHRQMADQ